MPVKLGDAIERPSTTPFLILLPSLVSPCAGEVGVVDADNEEALLLLVENGEGVDEKDEPRVDAAGEESREDDEEVDEGE